MVEISFSQAVKEELLVKKINHKQAKCELIAIFKALGNVVQSSDTTQIEIKTSQIKLTKRILEVINHTYPHTETQIIVRTTNKFKKKNKMYIINILTNAKLIMTDLGLIENQAVNFIFQFKQTNFTKMSTKERQLYTRMFFCATGSVNDPRRSGQYHLEITNNNEFYLNEIKNLTKQYNINFKLTRRKTSSSLYLNKGEEIADFLKFINAFDTLLEFEDYRLIRDMKLVTNRLNNADLANEVKKMSATQKQISAIDRLKETGEFDELSEKTQLVANLRITFPDDSLSELANRTDGEISKSNISHHLRLIIKKGEK